MPRYDISIRVAATRYIVTEAKPKLEPKALFLRLCGLFCELHGLRVGVCDSYLLLSADVSGSARGQDGGGRVYTHRINVLFLVICVCTLGVNTATTTFCFCRYVDTFLMLLAVTFIMKKGI